jgi:hypothetical protein
MSAVCLTKLKLQVEVGKFIKGKNESSEGMQRWVLRGLLLTLLCLAIFVRQDRVLPNVLGFIGSFYGNVLRSLVEE